MDLPKKILKIFREISREAKLNPSENDLRAFLADKVSLSSAGQATTKILVQAVEDYSYIQRLVFFLTEFKRHTPYQLHFNFVIIPFQGRFKFFRFFLYEWLVFLSKRRKWHKFYKAFKSPFAFTPSKLKFSLSLNSKAKRLLAHVKTKKDLESISYRGILIGDLIYDTYLRTAHKPTVDLQDPFVREICDWAIFLFHKYDALFEKNKFEFYITSYTTYIHHGIAVRIALQKGVRVIALGAARNLALEIDIDSPYHVANFRKYRKWFANLSGQQQEQALKIGHEGLKKRLSGQLDSATWYMKQSAYKVDGPIDLNLGDKNRPTVLIVCHDFFDSPHIYGKMLFPDFHEWLEQTLAYLTEHNYEILIKPHPNAIAGNEDVLHSIVAKFRGVTLLPPITSTKALVERGIDLALTVYGTVAHELAYMNVPVICCSENPHLMYEFCLTILDLESYVSHLSDVSKWKKIEMNKDQVAEFYYCHNFFCLDNSFHLFPFTLSSGEALKNFQVQDEQYFVRSASMKKAVDSLFYTKG